VHSSFAGVVSLAIAKAQRLNPIGEATAMDLDEEVL
jgi:hypothetical protein